MTAGTKRGDPFPYEFGGPLGALATTLALPVIVLSLAHCTKVGYLDLENLPTKETLLPVQDPVLVLKCALGLIGWFLLLVLLWWILPGPKVQGAPIHGKKDKTLHYKLNGHLSFWVIAGMLLGMNFTSPRTGLNDFLFRYYEPLAMASIAICTALSVYIYVMSFFPTGKILAKGGNSGVHIYDFFMGRELNPRLGSFDWKVFCELRPGLIGWMLLNLACLQEQYQVNGNVSGSMWLINIFHAIYVWDALFQERSLLTTMDVTTDGLGYMLVFGDMAWVPFTYSVPAKYLVHHDPHLGPVALAAIVGMYVLGFYIFRSSNTQKDIFRRNPNDPRVAHLSYLQTKRGTRLLTSGWWGMARKVNYTGDYLMGLTYSVLCGFDSAVPYFYAVYFAILLIHRSIRDDDMCHAKYGADWIEYKRQVPYRFIPGVI